MTAAEQHLLLRRPTRGWLAACAVAAVLLLPLVFQQDFVRSMLSSMGIAIILALSYNLLYGQAGVLSFGHALYSGLGAFCAMHVLARVNTGLPCPIVLLPLVGGAAGLVFGVLFGYWSTKRNGTAFAMITLGLSELVSAGAQMLPAFFGGEVGVSANRALGGFDAGLQFGSPLSVYYLIVAWMLLSVAAMYGFTHTPLGRIANALRDNPQRLRFIGYNPRAVRFRVQLLASFFAGIAGALSAIHFEIVTIDAMGVAASGTVMLMTVIGGAGSFWGPVLGAVLVTLMETVVSSYTHAWLFYFGLLFLVVIYITPQGLVSLAVAHRAVWRTNRWTTLLPVYARKLSSAALALLGVVYLVEAAYRLSEGATGGNWVLWGVALSPAAWTAWLLAIGAIALGGYGLTRGYALPLNNSSIPSSTPTERDTP